MPNQPARLRLLAILWALTAVVMTFVISGPAHAATRYLTLINDDERSVVGVEIAPAGSQSFQRLAIPTPLEGGLAGQATVALPPNPCRIDVRVLYRDASLLTVTGWNSCRQSIFRFGAARRAALLQRHPA